LEIILLTSANLSFSSISSDGIAKTIQLSIHQGKARNTIVDVAFGVVLLLD